MGQRGASIGKFMLGKRHAECENVALGSELLQIGCTKTCIAWRKELLFKVICIQRCHMCFFRSLFNLPRASFFKNLVSVKFAEKFLMSVTIIGCHNHLAHTQSPVNIQNICLDVS